MRREAGKGCFDLDEELSLRFLVGVWASKRGLY
jgi:hypothetical protein